MAATSNSSNDESTKVLTDYLELFHCLGYRYKYHLAPNAVLDWFGTRHIRGAVKIHEFLLMKFHGSLQHVNFDKANFCSAIEQNELHVTTKRLSSKSPDLLNAKNKVAYITSLKSRAESDIESDTDITMSEVKDERDNHAATTAESQANFNETTEAPEHKRARYSTPPPPTPFKRLRFLPIKRRRTDSSDDEDVNDYDSTDDEAAETSQNTRRTICNDYTPLRYLEATGILHDNHADGESKEQRIRLRLSYRKNLKNQTIQFALIIYERLDQPKFTTSRRRARLLDFTKCLNDDDGELSSTEDPLECIELQPAVILSGSKDGDEHETTIATVATPNSAEIATALEEAAFAIQPPVQRTPTKATPIPPGTPKRRPRSAIGGMSGILPFDGASTHRKAEKRLPSACKAPKLSAARSLRL